MAAAYYAFGVILVFGLAGALNTLPGEGEPVEIEKARNGARIVAGWEAREGQIPYQVGVRMVNDQGNAHSCGGSIIHHNWVITAAHCLAPRRFTFVVRFGLTNLTRPAWIVQTTRKYIHPWYDEVRAGVQTDDIALLGFDQHIPYGPTIQPCRLQNTQDRNRVYTGVRLTVSGFGLTDDERNGGRPSEALLWVHLLGITNEECRQWYNTSTTVQDRTICAESYNDTAQSACQGDSGGPLTEVGPDGKPTMVGIVSFGSAAGCNSPWPGAFVRPGHYHDWFLDVTGINFDWRNEDLVQPQADTTFEEVEPSQPIFVNN